MVPSLLRPALVDGAARAERLALHGLPSAGPPGAGSYSGLATGRGNGASRTKPMTQVISSTRTWACAL